MGPFPPAMGMPPMVGQPPPSGVSAIPPNGGGPGGGGLPRLIFSVQQTLDTIARAIPDASEQIDQIKNMLMDVLLKATQGGPAKPPGPMMEPGGGGY